MATVARLLDTTACPVIVVDNASDDDSLAAARRLAAGAAGRVHVIAAGRNLGAVGRNVGVAACATPYVAFCDDDSWWTPDAPGLIEELFARHPSVGLLAATTLVWPRGSHRCAVDPMVESLAGSPLGTRAGLPGPSILGFLSCSAAVRVEAFTAAGGFSPILHFRGEEQLLALDMSVLGWDLCYCPELVAVHRPSNTRPASITQDARSLRNAVLTTWLRRPPRRCAQSVRRLLAASVRDRAYARAAAEALVKIPAVLRQRRRLPDRVEDAVMLLESCAASA